MAVGSSGRRHGTTLLTSRGACIATKSAKIFWAWATSWSSFSVRYSSQAIQNSRFSSLYSLRRKSRNNARPPKHLQKHTETMASPRWPTRKVFSNWHILTFRWDIGGEWCSTSCQLSGHRQCYSFAKPTYFLATFSISQCKKLSWKSHI